MPRALMLVFTNPVEGKEDEFNAWYDKHHVPDIVSTPGVISGERFKLAAAGDGFHYLAVYELDADDPAAVADEIRRRGSAGMFVRSEAIDLSKVRSHVFASIPT